EALEGVGHPCKIKEPTTVCEVARRRLRGCSDSVEEQRLKWWLCALYSIEKQRFVVGGSLTDENKNCVVALLCELCDTRNQVEAKVQGIEDAIRCILEKGLGSVEKVVLIKNIRCISQWTMSKSPKHWNFIFARTNSGTSSSRWDRSRYPLQA
ncbi:hypothetical protein PIB30_084747, partial [Stylosanthes scabra]|nr:hypothetical protein [Stylosanthes scabra]